MYFQLGLHFNILELFWQTDSNCILLFLVVCSYCFELNRSITSQWAIFDLRHCCLQWAILRSSWRHSISNPSPPFPSSHTVTKVSHPPPHQVEVLRHLLTTTIAIQISYPAKPSWLSPRIWWSFFSSQNSDGKYPSDYSPVQLVMGCWDGDICNLCWMWSTAFRLHQQDWWDRALLCRRQICVPSWTPGPFYGHFV